MEINFRELFYLILTIGFGSSAIVCFILSLLKKPQMIELAMATFLFSGLFFSLYDSTKKEKIAPIQYENKVVCGEFLGESRGGKPAYRVGGIGYTLQFNLENYGYVIYNNINMGRQDISTGVNYNKILSMRKLCLKIRTQAGYQKWGEDIRIVDYWSQDSSVKNN